MDENQIEAPPSTTDLPATKPTAAESAWEFVKQYLVPTAIATLVASAVSVYSAVNAAHEQQRDYNTKFEQLVDSQSIMAAFGGVYVADPKPGASSQALFEHHLDQTKAAFTQTQREQQATATLLSLQSVAESEKQRRTVLLIGARLLNADTVSPATGSDAARLLTILIDEADRGRHSLNPFESSLNSRLWDTIRSPAFLDLVAAGYENSYYNDQFDRGDLRSFWPTLNGDVPISHDAKFEVLSELTPQTYEGWANLATFEYVFAPQLKPQAKSAALRTAKPAVAPKIALDLIADEVEVALNRDTSHFGAIKSQYAIPDPRPSPQPTPLFVAAALVDTRSGHFPATFLMVKHRLLRERPPVVSISPDGTFRKGSLGRVSGVVPAGACVSVVEPMVPVLVFVESHVITGNAPPTNGKDDLRGLAHLWAHIRGTKTDKSCLATR